MATVIRSPAVGVPFDDEFDNPSLSLDRTVIDVDPTPVALRNAATGVTPARLGIADYGSVALYMTGHGSELVSLLVEHHVAVVRADDIAPSLGSAMETLQTELDKTRGSAIVATGPSATADMGELVQGAHGPRKVDVIVVEEEV
ncbi:LUD domain-containing protein [Haloferax gibbonsii]|uniref:LUD domain-containing protein n=1 Tax=Haloferax gibbonsii TaxID=35746 RepID=UPI002F412F24